MVATRDACVYMLRSMDSVSLQDLQVSGMKILLESQVVGMVSVSRQVIIGCMNNDIHCCHGALRLQRALRTLPRRCSSALRPAVIGHRDGHKFGAGCIMMPGRRPGLTLDFGVFAFLSFSLGPAEASFGHNQFRRAKAKSDFASRAKIEREGERP